MAVDTSKHGSETGHGGFERQDLGAAGVIYFLLGLVAMTLLAAFLLTRFFDFLDKRENAQQQSACDQRARGYASHPPDLSAERVPQPEA